MVMELSFSGNRLYISNLNHVVCEELASIVVCNFDIVS